MNRRLKNEHKVENDQKVEYLNEGWWKANLKDTETEESTEMVARTNV